MRQSTLTAFIAATAAAFSLFLTPCGADDLATRGRAIFKKYQHTVVTVQIVLKSHVTMSGMGGQSSESRQDVTGTVVDPSGLTVLSLSATDPGQMMQTFMSGMSDEDSKFKMETSKRQEERKSTLSLTSGTR